MSFSPLLTTMMSGLPSPLRSATATAPGAWRPWLRPWTKLWVSPYWIESWSIDVLLRTNSGLAVAVEIADGQADGLVGPLVRLERAVAVAQDDQQVALVVADQQVGDAVAVDVAHGQAGRVVAGVDPGHRDEAPLAVVQEDRDILAPLR